jgi:hypothetical protein
MNLMTRRLQARRRLRRCCGGARSGYILAAAPTLRAGLPRAVRATSFRPAALRGTLPEVTAVNARPVYLNTTTDNF